MADASAHGRTGLAVPCARGMAGSPGRLVPDAIQKIPESLFVVDALPHTASGKIKKFALRERLHDREGMPRRRAAMTVLAAYSR
ncbi:hypothetical protein ACWD7C_29270 [Streptomyces sp. NPDC005134]